MTWRDALATEPPRVMTLRQAADYINGGRAEPGKTRATSVEKLRAECEAGRLVGIRDGRGWSVARVRVDEWLATRTNPKTKHEGTAA